MSTVVAMVHADKVYMAADQQVTDENYYSTFDATKLFTKGQLIMGVIGDYRANNTLPLLPPGKFKYDSDPTKFMNLTFPRLIAEFQDQYELAFGYTEILIGTKGHLFCYENKGESVSPIKSYHAIGSGSPFALGSLATSERSVSVTNRLRFAVQVGIRFDAQSGGEVVLLSQ